MNRAFIYLTLALLAACAGAARGQTAGTLLSDVEQIDTTVVLAAVAQAFTGRGWTLENRDDNSVTGFIRRGEATSRLRVYLAGKALMYEEDSTRVVGGSRQKSTMKRWRENIRHDVSTLLAGTTTRPSIADRLKALDKLRTEGVITGDEHKNKRAEILSDL